MASKKGRAHSVNSVCWLKCTSRAAITYLPNFGLKFWSKRQTILWKLNSSPANPLIRSTDHISFSILILYISATTGPRHKWAARERMLVRTSPRRPAADSASCSKPRRRERSRSRHFRSANATRGRHSWPEGEQRLSQSLSFQRSLSKALGGARPTHHAWDAKMEKQQ